MIKSKLFSKILLVSQTIQIISFPILLSIENSNTNVSLTLKWILESFQIRDIIKNKSQDIAIFFLYTIFCFFLINTIFKLFIIYFFKTRITTNNSFVKLMMQFTALCSLVTSISFLYPVLQTIVPFLICSNSKCFNNTWNTLHWIVALLCFLEILALIFLKNYFMIDPNLNSQMPFAGLKSDFVLLRLLPNFLIPVFSVIRFEIYGNLKIFSTIGNFCKLTLSVIPFLYTLTTALNSKSEKSLGKLLKNIQSQKEAEFHILTVIELIQEINIKTGNFIKFQGFLKFIIDDSENRNIDQIYLDLQKNDEFNSDNNLTTDQKKLIKKFIGFYIQEGIKKFPKSENLQILLASYQFESLKNFWLSVETMTSTVATKPDFLTEFSIYRISEKIKKHLCEKDQMEIKQSSFDVRNMLSFRESYLKFLRLISKGVKVNSKFWRELSDQNPNSLDIRKLGIKSVKNQEEVSKQYEILKSLSSHNKKFHLVYAEFLEQVAQKKEKGMEILEEVAQNQIYMNYKTENEKIFDNIVKIRESCIFTLGANKHNFGIILKVCNQVKSMIGYESQMIEGQNVEIIMPKYYHQKHDRYMMQYFKAEEETAVTVVNKNRVVFPETHSGYLKESKLRVRLFPNIERGIRVLGILTGLNEKDKEFYNGRGFDGEVNYLVYDRTDGRILGVSEGCFENFGISASLFSNTAWKMPKIQLMMPEAIDERKIKEMKESTIEVFFDTTQLMQQFYFDNMNYDEDHEIGPEGQDYGIDIESGSSVGVFQQSESGLKNEKINVKRAKVRAWITESSSLKNENLHCLRFQEVKQLEREVSEQTYTKIKKILDQHEQIKKTYKTTSKSLKAKEEENNVFNTHRLLKETKDKLEKKESLRAMKILNIFMTTLLFLSLTYLVGYFYVENELLGKCYTSIQFMKYFHQRIFDISDARFYARKLELTIK